MVSVACEPALLVMMPVAPLPLSLLTDTVLPLRSRTPSRTLNAPPGKALGSLVPSCSVPPLTIVVPE